MTPELAALLITAAAIGFFHTLFGPDHYLPFVAMGQARHWSALRTGAITVFCGLGHVLGSVVLGLVGVAFGIAVTKMEAVESVRGNLAAWALIAFGLLYLVWGLRRAARKSAHAHLSHSDAAHPGNHSHARLGKARITPWVLFTVFVLGPCEPLIPLLMYPAARQSITGMILVTAVFGVTTIGTMVGVVAVLHRGAHVLPLHTLERFSHALAGLVILLCGVAIQLGL